MSKYIANIELKFYFKYLLYVIGKWNNINIRVTIISNMATHPMTTMFNHYLLKVKLFWRITILLLYLIIIRSLLSKASWLCQ